MVSIAVAKKQRALSVRAMKARMPHQIFIRLDPLLDEGQFESGDTVFSIVEAASPPFDWESWYSCTATRNSRPHVQGGFAPSDEHTDTWDAIIPGGVPASVKVGDVARLVDTLGIGEVIEDKVFTIRNIEQDWIAYIARFQMAEYSVRRG